MSGKMITVLELLVTAIVVFLAMHYVYPYFDSLILQAGITFVVLLLVRISFFLIHSKK